MHSEPNIINLKYETVAKHSSLNEKCSNSFDQKISYEETFVMSERRWDDNIKIYQWNQLALDRV